MRSDVKCSFLTEVEKNLRFVDLTTKPCRDNSLEPVILTTFTLSQTVRRVQCGVDLFTGTQKVCKKFFFFLVNKENHFFSKITTR